MTREAQLGDLLMRWEELRQQGKSVAAEDLCADTPELRDELCRRIEALKALDQVLAITPQPRNSTLTCEQGAPPPREFPEIPGYEVLGELGHGGMGVVYKVRNLGIGRVEALKMMLSPKPQMIERFQQEIRAIAQFEHQRIVRIYAAGPADGQPYFTMEYIGSGSLSEHLGRFKSNRRAAVSLLAKVAQAVHFLHTKNIIHRDLKPGNILLRDQDEPLVSDFGLATFFERESEADVPEPSGADSQLTRTGAVMGTTSYMSPEQAAGRTGEFTAATDVWALGVILYELLAGRRPFEGKDAAAIRDAILKSAPARPRSLQPKGDKALESICLKCLEKEPGRRYLSAAALAIDLERWLRGDRGWRVWLAVLLGTVFAALLTGITLALMRPPNDPEQQDPDRTSKELLARVHAGEKVYLIGPKGRPESFDWILEGSVGPLSKEDAFTVHTGLTAMMELLRGPLPERYRFGAEMKQVSVSGDSGVFFGYAKHPVQGGDLHAFTRFIFSQQGETNAHGEKPAQRLPRGGPWHSFEAEVTPEKTRAFWDGNRFAEFGTKQLEQGAQFNLARKKLLPGTPYNFSMQGSLGLFLEQSVCCYRNVWVQKVEDSDPR
jgi:serine/threonine protein kinase